MKPSKPTKTAKKKTGIQVMQRGEHARLSGEIQRRIGSQLRAMYDDVVDQGIPDRFTQLLSQLDKRTDKDEK
jgi:hypothetical protein